jgi:hypothetical protein
VTHEDLALALEEFRKGLETELVLLRQLQIVATQQREVSAARDFDKFKIVSDERDRLMRSLLAIEDGLAGDRELLTRQRDRASVLPVYGTILALRQASSDLVNEILTIDRAAMQVLADADVARRAALASLERGESTLAAYRRVLAPPVKNAGLVNTRG